MTSEVPTTAESRLVVPGTVHAGAFLGYLLAGGLLVQTATLERMIETGLLDADDWDGVQPIVLTLAVPMLAAAVALHWGLRPARLVLAITGWLLAGFLAVLTLGLLGRPSVPATVPLSIVANAVAAVVMARLPYGQQADDYLKGRGRTRADVRAARLDGLAAPGGVRLVAGFVGLAALVGVVATVDLVVNANGSPLPPLAIACMAVALVRGLLRGRLWARAYSVIVFASALAGGLITLIGLWRASIPEEGFLASAPPDVGPAVMVTLLLMAVAAVLLYALAWQESSAAFFDEGW
ncbi:hypothetical protein [Microbispora catharanthi]|uniref:Uncharacterized protein n=1 Tax=Microbispora catharanthi TaxID=1712871 RepID=A0A5N6BQX8_9ACTN|nr:hypothetical protein [Microbispora catharanthi]KAB8182844.1 hypothetical protein FH610_022955 [Microbispora catharanthi]